MKKTFSMPVWTDEEKQRLVVAAESRGDLSLNQLARQLSLTFGGGRTNFAIRDKLHKLLMTPEQKLRWLETERRRYAARVPPYRNKSDQQVAASRAPSWVLDEHATRCAAPVRDLTALFCGDPPVGYSALERRA